MPLINCPECKNSVSDSAVSCPHCGFPIQNLKVEQPINTRPQTIKTKPIDQKKTNKGCQTVIIIFFILFMLIFFSKQCSKDENKTELKTTETIKISKVDSLKNVARLDSINKQYKIEEEKFSKTRAGKIHKKHPEWSKEDCKLIADGKIWIGMEYEMLVYQRGKPNDVNTSNYGNGPEYQACWDDYDIGCFYFDESHIITSYN